MLTGRDGELARLAIALADHAPVVVVGPAGVGKSTLCRTALTAAGDWHETGALATLRWSPLLLFRRLLGDAVRDEPDRVLAGRDRAAVIDRLMSLLRDDALFRNRPYPRPRWLSPSPTSADTTKPLKCSTVPPPDRVRTPS